MCYRASCYQMQVIAWYWGLSPGQPRKQLPRTLHQRTENMLLVPPPPPDPLYGACPPPAPTPPPTAPNCCVGCQQLLPASFSGIWPENHCSTNLGPQPQGQPTANGWLTGKSKAWPLASIHAPDCPMIRLNLVSCWDRILAWFLLLPWCAFLTLFLLRAFLE